MLRTYIFLSCFYRVDLNLTPQIWKAKSGQTYDADLFTNLGIQSNDLSQWATSKTGTSSSYWTPLIPFLTSPF